MATQSYRERMKAPEPRHQRCGRRSKQRVNARSSYDAKSTGWRWQR